MFARMECGEQSVMMAGQAATQLLFAGNLDSQQQVKKVLNTAAVVFTRRKLAVSTLIKAHSTFKLGGESLASGASKRGNLCAHACVVGM